MAKVNRLKSYFKDFFLLFFPETCMACDVALFEGEQYICLDCQINLPKTNFHQHKDHNLDKLFWGKIPLHKTYARYYYQKDGKVQKLIHHLKYKNQDKLGVYLGKFYANEIQNELNNDQIDYLMPIPITKKRLRSRGYNQCDKLIQGMQEVLEIPSMQGNLSRGKHKASQTKKGRFERWKNTKDEFFLSEPFLLEGKHILLIDDVITTGATMENAAKVLIDAGAKVSLLSLAFADS